METQHLENMEILKEQGWCSLAEQLVEQRADFQEVLRVAKEQGKLLADDVVMASNGLTYEHLNEALQWAQEYFREAAELFGLDFRRATLADLYEATARQLAYESGIAAVNYFATEDRKEMHQWDVQRRAKAGQQVGRGVTYLLD